MQAGKLKYRLSLQRPDTAQDEHGQPIPAWTAVGVLRGDVRFANGLESIKADASASILRCSVRVRWRAGVVNTMRLVDLGPAGTVFKIIAPLPDSTGRRFLDLVCEVST